MDGDPGAVASRVVRTVRNWVRKADKSRLVKLLGELRMLSLKRLPRVVERVHFYVDKRHTHTRGEARLVLVKV